MLKTYSLTKDTLLVSSESNIKNSSVVYVYGDEREYIESFEHKYDFKIGNILTFDDRVAYDTMIDQNDAKSLLVELNPMCWRKSNSWGFSMFSKEIQLEAVEMYLKGVSTGEIRKKFGIKGPQPLEYGLNPSNKMAFTASKIYIDRRQGIHIPLKSR